MAKKGSQGQALLEFVLLLILIITLAGLLVQGFRSAVSTVWKGWTREIAAPCPTCTPPNP